MSGIIYFIFYLRLDFALILFGLEGLSAFTLKQYVTFWPPLFSFLKGRGL